MSNRKEHFTEEFKKQMVAMYNSGKSATIIAREYGMAKSTLHKWISNPLLFETNSYYYYTLFRVKYQPTVVT